MTRYTFGRYCMLTLGVTLTTASSTRASTPVPNPPSNPPATPTPSVMCTNGTLFFDGKCRTEQFFRNRFVTPGSTMVSVEGSRSSLADAGVIVVEAPNARTVRVRSVDSTKHQAILVTQKYMDGYEVLSEFTVTGWIDDDGYEHVITTIDQPDPTYATVWWEHTARRFSSKYTWGTDHCYDFYGDPVPGCGPLVSIASSSGTVSCEEQGEAYGDTASSVCLVGLAGATLGSLANTAVIGAFGPPGSAGTYASVAGLALTAGAVSCQLADSLWSAIGEALCEEPALAPATHNDPRSLALLLESRAPPLGEDPCEEIGGERYDGPPAVVGNSCSDVEGGDGEIVGLPYSEDDVLEVVVYGDPVTCDPGRVITASDNMCIVIN